MSGACGELVDAREEGTTHRWTVPASRRRFITAGLAAGLAASAASPTYSLPLGWVEVSILSFGAQPSTIINGALSAAINACSRPTRIRFPKGTYLIGNGGLSITNCQYVELYSNEGAVLMAANHGTQTLGSLSPAFLKFADCGNCGVSGLEFNGNGFASACLNMARCGNMLVQYNIFRNANPKTGLVNSTGGSKNTFHANLVIGNGWSGNATRGFWLGHYGSNAEYETNIVTEENTVHNCNGTGIISFGADNIIRNNTSYNNAGSGIITTGAAGRRQLRTTITGNVCYGNLFHGIQGDASPESISVGGLVENNICYANAYAGIYALRWQAFTVRSNQCYNNSTNNRSSSGIKVQCCYNINLDGNKCWNDPDAGTQCDGICIEANGYSSSDLLVNNNQCTGNKRYGIYVISNNSTITNCSIENNNLSGNGSLGLKIDEQIPGTMSNVRVGINNL